MKIISVLENQKIEKRIAITPDIAKKYIALGFEVGLSENYGEHLGFSDNEYKELGVNIEKISMIVAWGDAWTNLIQPFWAIPLLSIVNLSVKDILGYCFVMLLFTGTIIYFIILFS